MGNEEYKGFLVRRATLDDIDDIVYITHTAFIKYAQLAGLETVDALTETRESVEADIRNKIVLVAFLDNQAVGSVRIAVNGCTGYLSRFGVSDRYQNLGIGKSLINMVDLEMRTLGVKRLSLHTASKVASLIRFYYSRGFYVESTSTEKGYIRAHLVKDYLF